MTHTHSKQNKQEKLTVEEIIFMFIQADVQKPTLLVLNVSTQV